MNIRTYQRNDTLKVQSPIYIGPRSTPKAIQMNDQNVSVVNSDTKVDPVVQNVTDKNKAVFEGMGKLKNFQWKLHIND